MRDFGLKTGVGKILQVSTCHKEIYPILGYASAQFITLVCSSDVPQ